VPLEARHPSFFPNDYCECHCGLVDLILTTMPSTCCFVECCQMFATKMRGTEELNSTGQELNCYQSNYQLPA
jgi:hypothetical protein